VIEQRVTGFDGGKHGAATDSRRRVAFSDAPATVGETAGSE
jgi:hypothetical protein